MSAITEKVFDAIFAKTSGSAVVGSGKLTGIHREGAPGGESRPYGVFSLHAPKPIEYGFGLTLILEEGLWLFKVLADEDSSQTVSAQKRADELLTTWITTLGNSLTLTGNTVVWCARFQDLQLKPELVDDIWVYRGACLVRIAATP